MELSELYSSKILQIAANLENIEPLKEFDAKVKKNSKICGSVVEVRLKLQEGVVSDYSHKVSACALGQTSASIIAKNIIGSSEKELRHLRDEMVAMLKHDGEPPSGKWSDLQYLQPVKSYPARHTSTLLVFEAIIACFDEIKKDNEAIS